MPLRGNSAHARLHAQSERDFGQTIIVEQSRGVLSVCGLKALADGMKQLAQRVAGMPGV